MSITAWIVLVIAAVAAAVFVVFVYRTREPAVRRRHLLIALRTVVLVLLLLVIFDPALPAIGSAATRSIVALDGSLSMQLPIGADRAASRWDDALGRARRASGGGPVLVFGDGTRSMPANELHALVPDAPHTRLLPALRAAAEAGARRLHVLSDGGIEDASEVAHWAARYGIEVAFEQVGDGLPGARSVVELDAPTWVEAGAPVPVRIGLGAGMEATAVSVRAPGADTVIVEVPPAAVGQVQVAEVALVPAAADGGSLIRVDVMVEGAVQTERSVYVRVGGQPAGVTLVSLRPDQEPRFLMPVLETALGLPVSGFLRVADGSWVRLGRGLDAGERAEEQDVRGALDAADLVVLHGAGGSAPEWLRTRASQVGRILVFPGGDGVPGLPVRLGQPVPDEFYLVSDVASSPVAPLLSGLDLDGLAPLTALRSAEVEGTAWAPLHVSRRRRGGPQPVALAGESDGQRWVVALGAGYWVWAFRGAEARAVYARLWGALAGWLMREEGAVATNAVRPVRRSIPAGERPAWLAPGLDVDSVRVALTAPGLDSALASVARSTGDADTLRSATAPPGHYSYSVSAFVGDTVAGTASGPLSVESYSPEFARGSVDMDALLADAAPVGPDARIRGSARPLHASAWPWVLIVTLLCAEWVLRRRWGLR